MNAKEQYELMKQLAKLKALSGTGTELLSIYVPPNFSISDEIAKLREEHGQASNIKSKTTRLNVQTAIDKVIQYLKMYKEPPPNGIAVFCGNISSIQANPDIELFPLEPPQPIKANIYRCDSSFLLDPIEDMLKAGDLYILAVMDGREATLATLRGTNVNIEKKLVSYAHSKISKGGQSAARYSRIIEGEIGEYYSRVGDAINSIYFKYNQKVSGLVLGGPGPAKEDFIRAKTINYQIKLLGVFDVGYTDEVMGIRELLEKSKSLLVNQDIIKENEIVQKFLNEVSRNGAVVYGYEKVKEALLNNSVAKLLISEEIDITEVKYKCKTCGEEFTKIEVGKQRQEKHSCGGNLTILEEKDPVSGLIGMADRNGVEVIFISKESEYGSEFFEGFGGIAAMLKYKN
ncbi:MAG: peptide chain release factor aRF-1 [Candidatus Micrarchaeia archaeon]